MTMLLNDRNFQLLEISYGHWLVFSYNTKVLDIFVDHGNILQRRLWDGWSATTQRHINKALAFLGLSPISKKDWDKMDVESL